MSGTPLSDASISLTERLIEFDSVSYKSNLSLIQFIADYLESLGFSISLAHDEKRYKANLFASIGPKEIPGIILSGHTDVVPVEGQEWTSDPFKAKRTDDRLIGRGAADMKGFIGLCLAMAPDFAISRLSLPLHLAFSYDEEVGCIGVRRMIADIATHSPLPRLCLIGEPTDMRIVTGHKGKTNVRCRVLGHECHSALNHRGVNAVEIAAEMVTFIRGLQRRIRAEGPFDPGYDPPYTTLQTGVIEGGTALNIVARDCKFEFEIRNLPSHDAQDLMAEIRGRAQDLVPEMLAISEEAGFFMEEQATPGLDIGPQDEAVRLATALAGDSPAFGKVSFTTEAGLFQQARIPTVVCGPGSITQAHKPDEYITFAEMARGEAFLRALLQRMTAPALF